MDILESLIGLSKEDGLKMCLDNGYKVRITRENSSDFIITGDLCFDRINLEIDENIISKCYIE